MDLCGPIHITSFLDKKGYVLLHFWLCVHNIPSQKTDINEKASKNGDK